MPNPVKAIIGGRLAHVYFLDDKPFESITVSELRSKIRQSEYSEALTIIPFMNRNELGDPDHYNQTALHLAVVEDYYCVNQNDEVIELCRVLLDKMDKNSILIKTTTKGETALHYAAKYGSLECVETFMNLPITKELIEMKNDEGYTALDLALKRSTGDISYKLYKNMDSNKINFLKKGFCGYTLLHLAVIFENIEFVKLLLEESGNKMQDLLSTSDIYGQTPLFWGADRGYTEICSELCNKMTKNQVLMQNENGNTALHIAACNGRLSTVQFLISNTEELAGIPDKWGQTALYWAAVKGYTEICSELYSIMTKDQVLIQNNENGYTVLHVAVLNNHTNIVRVLLKNNGKLRALLEVVDKNGQTALSLAEEDSGIYSELYSRMK